MNPTSEHAAQLALQNFEPGGTYIGRAWLPEANGPAPVALREDGVYDLSGTFATVRAITEQDAPTASVARTPGVRIGSLSDVLHNSWFDGRDTSLPWLLSPLDLHVIKASGVTFIASLLERVIEERARGDLNRATELRESITHMLGDDLGSVIPGSEKAGEMKKVLIREGFWSQYLEVGIGPDAEIFTKGPVLSSVGYGAQVGIGASSSWNNPEPEVVLAVSSRARVVGATLGNDVNLRDVEGRSALLLGKAKDNNASGAIGPWIRLFDSAFSLADAARVTLSMSVHGQDGYSLAAVADISKISRPAENLVAQMMGRHHQYPDGAALFLGTPFAPVDDRDEVGKGFTHHAGDVVSIYAPGMGALVNQVEASETCPPWTFGLNELMHNLAARGLLATP